MNFEQERPLFAEERQSRVVMMLETQSKLYVPDLCRIFNVSPATIRNDLRELDSQGKLKRTHGGAISCKKAGYESDSNSKVDEYCDEKKHIAQCAAELIEDGDIIALDSGTTTYELAKCITHKKNLTIITNDVKIMLMLEQEGSCNIILIGGAVRHGLNCCVGPIAINSIMNLHVDKAFMATNAFSVEKGFSTPDINTAEVKRMLIENASEVIMLCDSSKIGYMSFARFASVEDVDLIITDNRVDKKVVGILNKVAPQIDILQV